MKRLKDESGFTLLEIMIALVIMVGIMGSIYSFLQSTGKMSNAINNYSDQHNMVLNTNQFIRTTLANATYIELVDVFEAEDHPEAGYSYLYCGPHGGLTLLDGSTGNKTDMYTTKDLYCKKLYILFKPENELNKPVASGVISGSFVNNQTVNQYLTDIQSQTGVTTSSTSDSVTYNGAYNDYTRPKAYGSLSVTTKVLSWPKEYDSKSNRVKYSTASEDNVLNYVNDNRDVGAYNFYMDNVWNGKTFDIGTELSAENKAKFAISDSMISNITFHNTDSIFVQYTHYDSTSGTTKLKRKYTPVLFKGDARYVKNMSKPIDDTDFESINVYDYDGNVIKTLPAAYQANVNGYARCVKFQRPSVEESSGVTTSGDVAFLNYTVTPGAVTADKKYYEVSFDVQNTTSEAIYNDWTYARKLELPTTDPFTIESCTNCKATGTSTITYRSYVSDDGTENSRNFGPDAIKHVIVNVSIENLPEPTLVSVEPKPSSWDVNQGAVLVTVTNTHASKKLTYTVKITYSNGTEVEATLPDYLAVSPGATAKWENNAPWVLNWVPGETPTVTITKYKYN